MGRLITPIPRESLTSGTPPKTDTPAERILKYIPAEVIAFYLAALGIIDSLPKETKGKEAGYWVILALGFVAAPLYILKLAGWAKSAYLLAAWSAFAFLVWAYSLGGAFKLIPDLHQPWIGSIALLAVTMFAALLPQPQEGDR